MAKKRNTAAKGGAAKRKAASPKATVSTATATVHIPMSMFGTGYAGPIRVEKGTDFEAPSAVVAKLKKIGYAE